MSSQGRRSIAITGATGLIGSNLCEHLRSHGWEVRALIQPGEKYPFDEEGIRCFRCELPDDIDLAAFEGADAVIHAAYMTRFTGIAEGKRINEDGTYRVLEAARTHNVGRFVFISSMSAQERAISYYGQSKYRLEQAMDASRDLILRPGLVMAKRGGLFERMRGEIERGRVIPMFNGGRQVVQTIHVQDLCEAFRRAIEREITGIITVAEDEGICMRDFILEIAKRLGVKRTLITMPHKPVVAALRAIEALGIRLPITSENVLGLVALNDYRTAGDLARLELRVRTARESMDELFAIS